MAGELPKTFNNARDEAAYDAVQTAAREKRYAENRLDQNLSMATTEVQAASGRIGNANSASRQEAEFARKEAQVQKNRMDTQMLLASMADYADQRGADAERYEGQLKDKYGDDWRQDVALRVFDPDEFPQKRDDQTPAQYDQHIEDKLIEKMIDPKTGKIKPQYKDDPELGIAAEWAKARYDERLARQEIAYQKDPNRTPEEKHQSAEIFAEKTTYQQQRQAVQEASLANPESVAEFNEVIEVEGDKAITEKTDNFKKVEQEASSMGSLMPSGMGG